jgi:coproporphyrinogen III oxidase-like Fe-S oxidoreductase
MNSGIVTLNLQNRYSTIDFSRLDDLFSKLAAEGLLQTANHMVRLTDAGRLIADTIAVKIFENSPLPPQAS